MISICRVTLSGGFAVLASPKTEVNYTAAVGVPHSAVRPNHWEPSADRFTPNVMHELMKQCVILHHFLFEARYSAALQTRLARSRTNGSLLGRVPSSRVMSSCACYPPPQLLCSLCDKKLSVFFHSAHRQHSKKATSKFLAMNLFFR